MAGAAVVTAVTGPGGPATATEEETAAAVGGPALLGAVVATAVLTVTSEGVEQAGASTVLSLPCALGGR